jgi:predicted Fe-Mo cluster-binding NifX family protein
MNNVAAYVIQEKDPDTAVEKLLNGTLEAFEPDSHHHDHHEHVHEGSCGGNCGGHHH